MSVVEDAEEPASFDAPYIVYSEEDECVFKRFACADGPWFFTSLIHSFFL